MASSSTQFGVDWVPPSDIDDLEDDIGLTEGLLASLNDDGDFDAENTRGVLQNNLRSMRKKLRKLQEKAGIKIGDLESNIRDSQPDIPTRMASNQRSTPEPRHLAGQSLMNDGTHDKVNPHIFNQSPTFSLPSRKRPRDSIDNSYDRPSAKTLRTTPSPADTGTGTPAYSAASADDSDDSFLFDLLPGFTKEEHVREMRYLQEVEERRRQEKEDEDFARLLQEEENAVSSFTSQNPSQSKNPSSSAYAQALLKPNGTLRPSSSSRSLSQPSQHHPQPSASAYQPVTNPTIQGDVWRGASTPLNISDDSDVEEIDYNPAQRQTSSISNTSKLPHPNPGSSYAMMPGTFPPPAGTYSGYSAPNSHHSKYASIGAMSVYGSSNYPFQLNSQGAMMPADRSSLSYSPYGAAGALPRKPLTGAQSYLPEPFSWGSNSSATDRYSHLYEQTHSTEDNEKDLQDLLKHVRPDEELTAEQQSHVPDGLKVQLMPHQCTGLAWMKKMEEGTNKGGILADDMGLGKTVQSISLMLANPPPEGKHLPNLVVAPVALVQQWKREIEKMVLPSHRLNVKIMHGSAKATSWSSIKQYDVIITTYGTLAVELNRKMAWDDKVKTYVDAKPSSSEECPLLGEHSKFHRVFLDEAQWVKNRNTKSSTAVCRVQSIYRWCLTGTPMQNNVDEIYSLIRFCRIKPYSAYEKFARDFTKPMKRSSPEAKQKAMQQLQVLLRAILLRRNKDSKIDGKPILQLPAKHVVEARVPFSDDEMGFYKALEESTQVQFNRYVARGSIGRNYSHALVLLLRLRQCCCHPKLITQCKDFMQTASAEGADYVANAKALDETVVRRLKEMEAFECPICMDANENPALFPCGHALCNDCLSQLTDKALSNPDGNHVKCPHCRATVDAMKITDLASFLQVHCPERASTKETEEAAVSGSDSSDEEDDESDEDDDDDSLKDFIVADDEGGVDTENDKYDIFKKSKSPKKSKHKNSKKGKSRKKGKAKEKPKTLADLRKEALRNKSAKKKYLKRLGVNWESSAKVDKTMEILQQIKDAGMGEKTIVFSSFTSFLDLVEVPLSRAPQLGTYARYDGSMSANHRNDAVMTFTDNPDCKTILVSLKAGNAGLNLTAANHVIILDPFWNPFVENQAADRCHRIGQAREVTVHRVLIGGGDMRDNGTGYTVEDRILALQEKKRELVETALDESAGKNVARLGVRELGYLFGVNSLG